MNKKIIAFIVAACIWIAGFPMLALAKNKPVDSVYAADIRLYAKCYAQSSVHRITSPSGNVTYPVGKAIVRYKILGKEEEKTLGGISYKSYWEASFSTSGKMVMATTYGYGGSLASKAPAQ